MAKGKASISLIIPAAGLGTRLQSITLGAAKEMLSLGGIPLIYAALLEAVHAGFDEAWVVVSPQKKAMARWIMQHRPPNLRVHLVEQPEARGVMDAVARAQIPTDEYIVLYPDYIHLAGQRGLQALMAARQGPGTYFALVEMNGPRMARMGRTAFAHCSAENGGIQRILGVEARAHQVGALHTTFAEIRCRAHIDLIEAGPLDDGRTLDILNALAQSGLLYGHILDGECLDTGIPAGFLHAQHLFEQGEAQWARLPERCETD